MSSILTNTGAMVALQSLKSINSDLGKTQSIISTGKSVASSKDNSAVWAISKVMESDVQGFKAISSSLSLGESTVSVARQASETVTDLLTQMKDKIVAAQADNVDRGKLQTDVTALRDQIKSVVGAAQFNGQNLVNGTSGNSEVLSSLDRDTNGNVTASKITVVAQDLSTGGYVAKAAFTGSAGASTGADTFAATLDAADTTGVAVQIDAGTTYAVGDKLSITIGEKTVSHTVSAEEISATNPEDLIGASLKGKIDKLGISGLEVDFTSGGALTIKSKTAAAGPPAVVATANDIAISGQFTNAGAGGLGALDSIDVSGSGAAAALGTIETLINTAIDASASFGSAQGRIESQADFISNLTDSLKSGIGSLVDADMEETSARLQALQVQQQLGVQSLSIANQAPQSILSLFR